ncbi:GNAT family N-acetyltransferase [Polynucleobacter sp. JS-Mosq-20-D10]|uniref:GNAT family N-acetyltransferase n=1 Tax=Polynucleobacter sp. JS-Mosq-20-D10 TaxID=2576922 RepID=UPI001BFEA602|nr:GNAT family N-acetyltransferase [Polynucleobacter sp. JS-Mosq-20-D10]QWE00783.1 GNAT family N-acetyltransferase [Polynucleobacter sp. JS-Mosq-20-D10]
MRSDIKICEVKLIDFNNLASIHRTALPEDVLPSFGPKVLENFYKKTIELKSNRFIVAKKQDKVIGFILLSKESIRLFEIIFSYSFLCGFFRVILFKPSKILVAFSQIINKVPLGIDAMEITYIAIMPEYQGLGVGGRLLNHIPSTLKYSNIKFIETKTSNEKLFNYYVKSFNAKLVHQFTSWNNKYYAVKWVLEN